MQSRLKRDLAVLATLCVAVLLVAPAYAAKPYTPATPSDLTATAVSTSQIDLAWTDNSDNEDDFGVERSLDGSSFSEIATVGPNVTTYSDTGLSASTTYYYRVRARRANLYSDYSNIASDTTSGGDTTPPAAPTNLSASVVSGSQIDLDWDDNTEGDLDGYNVYRDTASGVPVDAGYQIATGLASSDYSDTTVDDQTTYYYVVTAVDTSSNESAASNEASATTPDETPPAAPTNLSATGVSQSQIDLDWDDSPEPDWSHYNVYRDTSSGFTCDVNTLLVSNVTGSLYSDLSLPANTTYYYKVTAVDTSYNESGASNEASATTLGDTTPPAAPTNLSATAVGYDQIDLDWEDNTEGDLDSYNVYRDGSPLVTGLTSSSYSDTGLSASTQYCYTVTAVDTSDNESAQSNQACATTEAEPDLPPAAPTNLTATAVSETQIDLDWDDNTEPDLDSYNVYSDTTSGFVCDAGTLLVSGLTASAYSDTGLSAGTTHYYKVTAMDTAYQESDPSNEASATTSGGGPNPDVIAIEDFEDYNLGSLGGQGTAEDGWAGAWNTNASDVVDVSANPLSANGVSGGNKAVRIGYGNENGRRTFADTIYPDTGGVWMSYLMRWDANVSSASQGWVFNTYSNWDHRFAGFASPGSQTGDCIVSISYGNSVKGGPDIFQGDTVMVVVKVRSDRVDMWVNPSAETDTPDVSHTGGGWTNWPGVGLTNRNTAEPWIIDRIVLGNTFESVVGIADTTPPAAPTGLTATTVSAGQIDLDWDDNTDPDLNSYNVYRGTAAGVAVEPGNLVASGVATSSHSDTGLSDDTTYYYVVTAVDNNSNESGASNEASATTLDATPPAAPTSLSATTVSTSQIDLDWADNTEGDLASYNVYRDTTSGVVVDPGNQVATGVAASAYSDTDLLDNTTYYYVVTAVDTSDNESAASNEASATTQDAPPSAPTGLAATAVSASQIDLDWNDNPEPDVDSYNVYRDTSAGVPVDGSHLLVSGVTASNYSDISLPENTTYYYVVTAMDAGWNESPASNEASAKTFDTVAPAAPTNLSAVATGTRIDLDWDDNAEGDLSHYNVYRDTSAGVSVDPAYQVATDVQSSDYSDTGLAEYTTYYYVVTAVDTSTNESAASNEASASTTTFACGSPSGGPTDNPVATFYGSGTYTWTDNITWECVYNVDDYSGTDMEKYIAARDDAYANGGGVVYFPAGTYYFSDDLYLRDGVVIRGATPSTTDAKNSNFAPPTRFEFPEYTGPGGEDAAFKNIRTEYPATDSNIGVVWVDINRAGILLHPTTAAPWDTGITSENMVVFGVRTNNVGSCDPGVPDPAYNQESWQRWMYRFTYNYKLYNYRNILMANTRSNDNITDNFEQPGYVIRMTDGSYQALEGYQAVFNYALHYVMEVGKGDHSWGPGTPETMPANFRTGITIRDNWAYGEARVKIMFRGDGAEILDNVLRDREGKVHWIDPTGKKQLTGATTMENRGIDFAGYNLLIDGNDYEVYRHDVGWDSYMTTDGEGIMSQECCGGTYMFHETITNNYGPHATYIGLYKVQDIYDVYIYNNNVTAGNIYVNANTNTASYPCDDVIIDSNTVAGNILLLGDVNGSGNYITNNTASGSGRSIQWSCETNASISGNSGFTVESCQ